MATVIGELTPYALTIALSPLRVILVILMLLAPRPQATAGAFLAGWAVGIVTAAGVFAAIASVIERREETPAWGFWARIGLGVVLLLLGVRLWLKRRETAEPAWMQSVERTTPTRALQMGLLLSAANPKTLLLTAAGGLAIGSGDLILAGTVVGVAVFTAIAAVPIALPLLLHALLGERILAPLGRAREWLTDHNASVMAVGVTAVGLLLVAQGMAGLRGA